MKKFIFLMSGILFSAAIFAQLSLGVEATGSITSATVKSKYDLDFNKDVQVRPSAAFVAQYDFSKRFAIRAGLGFSQLGVTAKYSEDEFGSSTVRTRLNYIQLPVHAIYKTKAGSNMLYAGLGGYAGYGFGGEAKFTMWHYTDDGGYDVIEKLNPFKSVEDGGADLERFDYGLSALAGLQLKNGIYIQVGYQHGLANIERDNDNTYRNRGIGLTVGYFFKRK
ncbi:MAG TPA: outer membrane beta-barrel protein [Chitinophagaceae bacterium]